MRAGTWQPGRVDPGPVREHVERLRRVHGMSLDAIAAAAGVGQACVHQLAYHRHGRPLAYMLRPTAEAILAVRSPLWSAPDASLIGATGTRRRLEALLAAGWSASELGVDLGGVSRESVRQYRTAARVTARTARMVASLYDELADFDGPSRETRRRAKASAFAPPWQWYDAAGSPIDIDDPAARPYRRRLVRPTAPSKALPEQVDEVAVQRAVSGAGTDRVALTIPERVEAVRILAARGWSDAEIAARVGVDPMTVLRDRTGHGIASRWTA